MEFIHLLALGLRRPINKAESPRCFIFFQVRAPETQKKSMGDYRLLRNPGVVVGIILLHLFAFASLVSSNELQFGEVFLIFTYCPVLVL